MPFLLATTAVKVSIITPATAETLLILSCDLILILIRAFKVCIHRWRDQPLTKDIEEAAVEEEKWFIMASCAGVMLNDHLHVSLLPSFGYRLTLNLLQRLDCTCLLRLL